MLSTLFDVIKALGGAATLAVAAGWVGQKLFEGKLQKDLEAHKAKLSATSAGELEKLRHDLSAELDRRTRLLAREFDALTFAWDLIHTAAGAAELSTRRYRQYLDVANLPDGALREMLGQIDTTEHIRATILNAEPAHRQHLYQQLVNRSQALNALEKAGAARNYLIGQSIFIERQAYDLLLSLAVLVEGAAIEQVEDQNNPVPREGRFARSDLFRAEWPNKMREAEAAVRARLEQARL
jgi:hypothetical protein